VRFVYLDETGTGDPQVEPWLIFAGVMVHEHVWKAVERRLIDLADKFAQAEDRFGFVFHANELFTGGKKGFRERYPLAIRHDALAAICSIPQQFDLPIFMYGLHRPTFATRNPTLKANELLSQGLMHVSLACATGIEKYMRDAAPDGELVTLVYEHNSDKNEGIREYHQMFRSDFVEEALKQLKPRRLMRFERIIETAMFSKKTESSLLQIADACAYCFGRRIRGVGLADRFYRPIKQQLKFGLRRLTQEAV
jgi:hypothetical protein